MLYWWGIGWDEARLHFEMLAGLGQNACTRAICRRALRGEAIRGKVVNFLLNIYYCFLAKRNSHEIFHSSFMYFMNEKFHVRLKKIMK